MSMGFPLCERLKGEQREGSNIFIPIFIPTQTNFSEDFCEHISAGVV